MECREKETYLHRGTGHSEKIVKSCETQGGGRPLLTWQEFELEVDMVLVKRMVDASLTDWQIATVLGVSEMTLHRWKQRYPQFMLVLNEGKNNEKVERSLFQRATGYDFLTEKIFLYRGKIIRVPIIKHVIPDISAIMFWLCNRDPQRWSRSGNKMRTINPNDYLNVHVTSEIVIKDLTN